MRIERVPAAMGSRSAGASRCDSVGIIIAGERAGDGPAGILHGTHTDPSGGDDLDLVDVLPWGRRTGVVDEVDLAVLVELEFAREFSGIGAQQFVAQSHGWTVRTVQRRRDRALAALRSAGARYLAAA